MGGDSYIAGMNADFVIYDEWEEIERAYLEEIADANTGVLRRAAQKEIKKREAEQAELESTPGYGSF